MKVMVNKEKAALNLLHLVYLDIIYLGGTPSNKLATFRNVPKLLTK